MALRPATAPGPGHPFGGSSGAPPGLTGSSRGSFAHLPPLPTKDAAPRAGGYKARPSLELSGGAPGRVPLPPSAGLRDRAVPPGPGSSRCPRRPCPLPSVPAGPEGVPSPCGARVPHVSTQRPPSIYLHVLSEGAGVRVGLVTHFAEIGLVGSVHMHVLFAVAAVCKAPVTALKFTLKWFFTYCRGKGRGGGGKRI